MAVQLSFVQTGKARKKKKKKPFPQEKSIVLNVLLTLPILFNSCILVFTLLRVPSWIPGPIGVVMDLYVQ